MYLVLEYCPRCAWLGGLSSGSARSRAATRGAGSGRPCSPLRPPRARCRGPLQTPTQRRGRQPAARMHSCPTPAHGAPLGSPCAIPQGHPGCAAAPLCQESVGPSEAAGARAQVGQRPPPPSPHPRRHCSHRRRRDAPGWCADVACRRGRCAAEGVLLRLRMPTPAPPLGPLAPPAAASRAACTTSTPATSYTAT